MLFNRTTCLETDSLLCPNNLLELVEFLHQKLVRTLLCNKQLLSNQWVEFTHTSWDCFEQFFDRAIIKGSLCETHP